MALGPRDPRKKVRRPCKVEAMENGCERICRTNRGMKKSHCDSMQQRFEVGSSWQDFNCNSCSVSAVNVVLMFIRLISHVFWTTYYTEVVDSSLSIHSMYYITCTSIFARFEFSFWELAWSFLDVCAMPRLGHDSWALSVHLATGSECITFKS